MNNSFKEFINDYSNINKEGTVTHEYKYGVLYHNDKGFYFYDNNKFSIIDRKFTGMAKKDYNSEVSVFNKYIFKFPNSSIAGLKGCISFDSLNEEIIVKDTI